MFRYFDHQTNVIFKDWFTKMKQKKRLFFFLKIGKSTTDSVYINVTVSISDIEIKMKYFINPFQSFKL